MKKLLEVKNYIKIVLTVSYKILEINSQEIDKKLRKENSEDYEKKSGEFFAICREIPKVIKSWKIGYDLEFTVEGIEILHSIHL